MNIIDLTHTISPEMPVYPNTPKPEFKTTATYEVDGCRETFLTIGSHTGTHIDAPAHIIDGAITLEKFSVSQFIGKALVIDCRNLKEGEKITKEHILKYNDKIEKADFLLFNLGWDKRWGNDDYFGDFPCLDDEAIDLIVEGNYKGIGFDVISIDSIGDKTLKVHNALFSKKQFIVIENLKNLELCGNSLFTLVCLPLKFENADGAPTRAVAIMEE